MKVNSLMPLIADYLKDFIIALDDDGNVLYINKSMLTALGYENKEVEYYSFLKLLHDEDVDRTIEAFNKSKDTGVLGEFRNRYLRKDGTELHLKWRQSFTIGGITFGVSEETH